MLAITEPLSSPPQENIMEDVRDNFRNSLRLGGMCTVVHYPYHIRTLQLQRCVCGMWHYNVFSLVPRPSCLQNNARLTTSCSPIRYKSENSSWERGYRQVMYCTIIAPQVLAVCMYLYLLSLSSPHPLSEPPPLASDDLIALLVRMIEYWRVRVWLNCTLCFVQATIIVQMECCELIV